MKIYYNGFDTTEITFKSSTDLQEGRVVSLSSDGKVYYTTNSKDFTGIVSSCKDKVASIIIRGHAVARFRTTTPTIGICKLAPSGNGYMEVDESNGKAYTVVGVDYDESTFEFIL